MPRNAAVRFGTANTQAMVRPANHRKHLRKSTKARGSYLPKPKILRIQQLYIAGENKTEIAKKEKVDRETVARIVQFPEVQDLIAQAQQEFFGLVPDALAAVRYALQVEKNAMIGLTVLERTGVLAPRGERMQLPATSTEDGYSRQAVMIANVLLEEREHMGLDLGPEIEEALVESTDCEHATAEVRSLRSVKDANR